MTTRRVFVDETKHRSYLMVATTITDTIVLRASLRELLLPNQRFLHMRNEREGRRRQIAATIAGAGVRATVYKASRGYRTEKQQRAACLRQLVRDNADGIQTLVILDQDESLLRWDKQRLIEFTRAEICRDSVRYEHRRGQSEPLLAVPDAIAWCWAKGGAWRGLVEGVVVAERDV
jgi:hypothetical protein